MFFVCLFLIFGDCPHFSFFPVPVPPVPVPCPLPPVPVPKTSGFRFPVRFASFLNDLYCVSVVISLSYSVGNAKNMKFEFSVGHNWDAI